MQVYNERLGVLLKRFSSDSKVGLKSAAVRENAMRYGANRITRKRQKSMLKRVIEALFEPMMLILCFAFLLTFGINIGKAIACGGGNFYECAGIFIAIAISVALTVIMEGKSQKAFELLSALGDDGAVRVIRDGNETIIKREEIVVGDIMLLEAGDKVCADGRIISCDDLYADESTLTGESKPAKKREGVVGKENAGISDIFNMLFSGTYLSSGKAKIIVTAVGDGSETGKLAGDVLKERSVSAPLEEKLSRLGKLVTTIGSISAGFVFVLSIVRLFLLNEINFFSVENAFIEAVVLIVAAVPEGLPTTVAISLTLNVVKLAKSNALIKKLVATETVGCVSVICADKTGTLTENKMSVDNFVIGGICYSEDKLGDKFVALNCAVNSTAIISGGKIVGSATEGALLNALSASGKDYSKLRKGFETEKVVPFSSDKKYMQTEGALNGEKVVLLKGAPEVVLKTVYSDNEVISGLLSQISEYQKKGKRVIAFAHQTSGEWAFDGYAVISDKIRSGVKRAVKECRDAGVRIMILTGDGIETARSVAAGLALSTEENNVVTADYIDGLKEDELKRILLDISVIARSTPRTKLAVVKALQKIGEVVAVTGDGVNDAPAIRHADIGIAMGSGSEITKEASDVVLLDDSFSTILTAISFGRNVYSNFQRFISFQLTVNLASMSIIIAYLLLGFKSPFSSVCLLWLNVIMDGPLALSLGLEQRALRLDKSAPVRRGDDILSKKMLARIIVHSFYMCAIVALQKLYNFLGVSLERQDTVVITMFVFFQLFNAINCREVLSESALKNFFSNGLFVTTFAATFALHIVIVQLFPSFFGTTALSVSDWIKIVATCSTVLLFSEGYKAIYRLFRKNSAKFSVIKSARLA